MRLCSTPFGITGCFAASRSETGCWPQCAQRLSASQGVTLRNIPGWVLRTLKLLLVAGVLLVPQRLSASQGVRPFLLCSTPFGITGCFAWVVLTADRDPHVCSTPFGITGCYAKIRLFSTTPTTTRAQRLSASQGVTLLDHCNLCSRIDVLNAFRHHRVLRIGRSSWTPEGIECSTPFGITGCYARRGGDNSPLITVLNAFRHHRVLRHHTPIDPFLYIRCSTPFGITGCYAQG